MAKILVIDDDLDILLATRLVLESSHHTVIEARSSKEGLDKAKAERPDLIILDVMMETPTAGFQTALTLRSPDPASEYAALSHIPIIMLTAIHQTTPMRFGPDESYLPVDAFLDKPFRPEQLLKQVAELLAHAKPVG